MKPDKDMQTSLCTFFLNTGNDFNKDEFLSVPLNKQGSNFKVELSVAPNVKSIRFDPFEGYGCIITHLRILVDG